MVLKQLSEAGLAQSNDQQWRRVVIEKPFGHDLGSARELNAVVNEVFPEDTVFRIDHYLGKETVQNILALRFANQLFDPIWNATTWITSRSPWPRTSVSVGVPGITTGSGGRRATSSRTTCSNSSRSPHEEPISFEPSELQAEKIKVLSATKLAQPLEETTARGQYAGGWQGGTRVVGLLEEEGFSKDSTTETFAAITLEVDTRRWAGGVPFYLRTGKRLGRRVTEIAVIFKRAPHLPFDQTMTEELGGQNALVIRVQPDEGVTMRFGSKVPGSSMEVRDVNMDFSYGQAFTESSPEAYERLILDVLLGEPRCSPSTPKWNCPGRSSTPCSRTGLRTAGRNRTRPHVGPPAADEMMHRTGREWRRP